MELLDILFELNSPSISQASIQDMNLLNNYGI